MQEKQFVELVEKLEVYSRERPTAYKLRVGLLAALGYFFLLSIIVGALALVAAVVFFGAINFLVIKLLIIPLGMAAVVLRSLWITFPEPEGLELQYAAAPRLFELVKEIGQAVDGPPVHRLLLTHEYNAGIVQRPRLGIFGWQENYLLVGLPLLQALSPDAVRAVISHEFGHLSGNHGKFSGWVYRVRQTWAQTLINMKAHRRYGSGIFERFFDWYAPYFGAYSFVLARAQEYEADLCSVALTGKEVAARALINLDLKEKALNEDFWPSVYGQADRQSEPPLDTFAAMLNSIKEPLPADKAQLWFSQSLARRHDYNDTHPSLVDRLVAIGFPEVRENADVKLFGCDEGQTTGDQYFLATLPADFIASQGRLWKERVAQGWRERYQFVCDAEKTLSALEQKAKAETLTLEEKWERARFMAGTKGYPAAIPLLQEVLVSEPDHAAANYTLGEALLEQGDEAGIRPIELAMEKDVTAIPAGCELIYYFLTTRNREKEAEKYRQCVVDYYAELDRANQERQNISAKDNFSSHDLPAETLRSLCAQLETYPRLASAHLVRHLRCSVNIFFL